MNKIFLFALFALVAACAAAPTEDPTPVEDLQAVATHATDKRAVIYPRLGGYRYRNYPSYGYNYPYTYPSSVYRYANPYYGRYVI